MSRVINYKRLFLGVTLLSLAILAAFGFVRDFQLTFVFFLPLFIVGMYFILTIEEQKIENRI